MMLKERKLFIFFGCFFVLTCAFIHLSIFAAENKTIKVVTEYYPPYSFTNKNGEIKGCSAELVRALFDITQDDLTIEMMPWARAYVTAENFKNTLIFSIARNQIRENKFYWIGKIKQEVYYFWALKTKYLDERISKKDFASASIVVAKYTTNDQMLTAMGYKNLHRVTELSQGINMLLTKRVDLIVETKVGMHRRFERMGYDFSRIAAVYEMPELNYDLYFAFNVHSDPQLVKRFRSAYQQLVDTGIFAKLLQQCPADKTE